MTYRLDENLGTGKSPHYSKIYYKPKGFPKFYEINVVELTERRKSKRRFAENDFHTIGKLVKGIDLPEGAERCYGVDVPKKCREEVIPFLDWSWRVKY